MVKTLLAIVVLVSGCAFHRQQPQERSIPFGVYVVDAVTEQPIAEAIVRIDSPYPWSELRRVPVSDGYAIFQAIPAQTLTFCAIAPGYERGCVEVQHKDSVIKVIKMTRTAR